MNWKKRYEELNKVNKARKDAGQPPITTGFMHENGFISLNGETVPVGNIEISNNIVTSGNVNVAIGNNVFGRTDNGE